MKIEKILSTTLEKGLIQFPKHTKLSKTEIEQYEKLATRVWEMVVSTLEKSPIENKETIIGRIHHSYYTCQYVYKIGKNEIKDDQILIELQIGALMHDMYKYYNCDHADTAASVALGLGLHRDVVYAIASHSDKPSGNQDIYSLVLIDADNLSKLTPEYLLYYLRSEKSKDKLTTRRKCFTNTGKDILKTKVKELDLLSKVIDIENSLIRRK